MTTIHFMSHVPWDQDWKESVCGQVNTRYNPDHLTSIVDDVTCQVCLKRRATSWKMSLPQKIDPHSPETGQRTKQRETVPSQKLVAVYPASHEIIMRLVHEARNANTFPAGKRTVGANDIVAAALDAYLRE